MGMGEDSKDLHRRKAFLHEDIFFYFIIMTGKLTMNFSLVSSMVLDRARRLPFFLPFSFFPFFFFFSFSFGRGISIIMIMIMITIVMAMAIYQSERKMENGSSSSSSSKNVLTFCFCFCFLLFAFCFCYWIAEHKHNVATIFFYYVLTSLV